MRTLSRCLNAEDAYPECQTLARKLVIEIQHDVVRGHFVNAGYSRRAPSLGYLHKRPAAGSCSSPWVYMKGCPPTFVVTTVPLSRVSVYSTETRLPFAIMRVAPCTPSSTNPFVLEFRDPCGEDQKDQKPVGECPNTRFVAATAVQDHTRENDRPLLFSGSTPLCLCREASWRPFRAPLSLGPVFQGLRSLHSLTPGYLPCTPPACETAGYSPFTQFKLRHYPEKKLLGQFGEFA